MTKVLLLNQKYNIYGAHCSMCTYFSYNFVNFSTDSMDAKALLALVVAFRCLFWTLSPSTVSLIFSCIPNIYIIFILCTVRCRHNGEKSPNKVSVISSFIHQTNKSCIMFSLLEYILLRNPKRKNKIEWKKMWT